MLVLLFCVGHTVGSLLGRSPAPEAEPVLLAMRTVHFDFKGADRTLDDIFFGLGLLVSLHLLVSVLVALRVASADASQWAIVAPFAWGLCATQAVTAAVAARYFFAGPAVLCGVAALLFGVGAARR
ncbi:MAG: hypothetical protein HOV80_22255 [Polyangiaceae bacterium]|nr:hypothetical protein [Polyangiaceae bacterium]